MLWFTSMISPFCKASCLVGMQILWDIKSNFKLYPQKREFGIVIKLISVPTYPVTSTSFFLLWLFLPQCIQPHWGQGLGWAWDSHLSNHSLLSGHFNFERNEWERVGGIEFRLLDCFSVLVTAYLWLNPFTLS